MQSRIEVIVCHRKSVKNYFDCFWNKSFSFSQMKEPMFRFCFAGKVHLLGKIKSLPKEIRCDQKLCCSILWIPSAGFCFIPILRGIAVGNLSVNISLWLINRGSLEGKFSWMSEIVILSWVLLITYYITAIFPTCSNIIAKTCNFMQYLLNLIEYKFFQNIHCLW